MLSVMTSISDKKGGKKNRLTINERILLHLLDNLKFKDSREVPQSITQRGIADGVHIRWNHVPRAVAGLKNRDYISEKTAHIEGKTRRQKVYFLTDEGKLVAKKLRGKISKWDVQLKKLNGKVADLKLLEINSVLGKNFSPLKLYLSLSEDNIIDAKELLQAAKEEPAKKAPTTFFVSGEIPRIKELLGRGSEIKTIQDWIDGEAYKTIVIYGSIGIGKSALMAEILGRYRNKKNIFWYQIPENVSEKDIITRLSEFLSKLGRTDLSSYLKNHDLIELDEVMRIIEKEFKTSETILAFDNYFKASESVVDLFSALTDLAAKKDGFKIMFTERETTPFFCRFYNKRDIHRKKIAELTLKGLDMENCKQLLGRPNIDRDALKKIHLMTRGHPLTIELIKRGDVNSLKRIKGFSRQEASLLLYLKSVERK